MYCRSIFIMANAYFYWPVRLEHFLYGQYIVWWLVHFYG